MRSTILILGFLFAAVGVHAQAGTPRSFKGLRPGLSVRQLDSLVAASDWGYQDQVDPNTPCDSTRHYIYLSSDASARYPGGLKGDPFLRVGYGIVGDTMFVSFTSAVVTLEDGEISAVKIFLKPIAESFPSLLRAYVEIFRDALSQEYGSAHTETPASWLTERATNVSLMPYDEAKVFYSWNTTLESRDLAILFIEKTHPLDGTVADCTVTALISKAL